MRANPNAISALERTCPIVARSVTTSVLSSQRLKGSTVQASG